MLKIENQQFIRTNDFEHDSDFYAEWWLRSIMKKCLEDIPKNILRNKVSSLIEGNTVGYTYSREYFGIAFICKI